MSKYASLGPFRREDTDKITDNYPDEDMYTKNENRLEIIGLRSLCLAGISSVEAESHHAGGQTVSILYHPSKLAALQVIEPLKGFFVGDLEAIDNVDRGLVKLSNGRIRNLNIVKSYLDEKELVKFCEEFYHPSFIGFDYHRYDVLNFFGIPYAKPDVDLFIRQLKSIGEDTTLLELMRNAEKREHSKALKI
jgi:hypothetical protein